jgi:hypothetical protein
LPGILVLLWFFSQGFQKFIMMHNRWTVKTTRSKLIKRECRELLFSDLGINPRGVFSSLSLFHTCNRPHSPIYIYPKGVFSSLSHTCNHPHGPYIYTHTHIVHWKYNVESFASLASLVLYFLTDPIIGSPGAIEVWACSDLHFCLVLTRSTCRSNHIYLFAN